jgi:uncharacterized membrane protein YtjA (UPF0391 family)
MLGWAVGFFVLSIIAAIFGFGGVATAFAGIAQLLFFVFIILFVLSLVVGLFTGGAHGGPALTGASRTLGLLAVVAIVAVGVYAWADNDWSAERLGRAIDRGAVAARDDAADAVEEVSEDTERFVDRSREDLKRNADEAAEDDKE